ncbi:MAG: glycosyltransferase family 9 protein [Microscillaceae bacterium]|nr:glycosyltransferase family 9 protein [Microscillaceae bacterium]
MKALKILIIRLSAIGDIVWTTPVIRGLKEQVSGAEVHFCTKAQYHKIVEANPYIDKIYYLKDEQNSLRELIHTLDQEKYDYVIDLHKNLRTTWIKFKLNRKSRSYHKLSLHRWLFINLKINWMPPIHVADRYLNTVKFLGVKPDGKGLDYFIAKDDRVSVMELPQSHQGGYVAFVIGASEYTKKLPHNKLVELCHKINQPLILVGGPEDQEEGNRLVKYFENHPQICIFNACGKYNISQSASLVAQARMVFGHDTGLTHIAAAFKKKVYIIFGSTSPLGFWPYETPYKVLENNRIKCRPCSKSGRANCPRKHFKCLKEIHFDFEIPQFMPK